MSILMNTYTPHIYISIKSAVSLSFFRFPLSPHRYGLTDIQEYYANTGALKRAAENKQRSPNEGTDTSPKAKGKVQVTVVEAFEKKVKV
jgi:hypothetical protein